MLIISNIKHQNKGIIESMVTSSYFSIFTIK